MTVPTLARISICALLLHISGSALARDPLSFAHDDQVKVRDVKLDLDADFERKTLSGYAELSLEWIDASAATLDLDTRDLHIDKIEALDANGQWHTAAYTLDPAVPALGQALHIDAAAHPDKVRVTYRTSPDAAALQWMSPAQTVGGKHPFMFSYNEPIQGRSWLPLQDTPAVRFSYSARIGAPAGLRVVMSANNDPAATGKGGWYFRMPQPIPSYLLAIAIGELDYRKLGPRTGIYAEPQRIAAAQYEMADTEKMMAAAETLYGPYRWGQYDMLVLPPSFPLGGMENPRLTFLTPTVIAGDRSLVPLVAHELAHSWAGNLVTMASQKHLWLNEGVTTYITNRIVEQIYGVEFATMALQVEQEDTLAYIGKVPQSKQGLVTEFPDTDAEHYTDKGLAYQKGAWFMRTLEQRAGRALFDPFLRGWFDQNAFRSVTTDQFKHYLQTELLRAHPEVMSTAELNAWLYGPGIPASALRASSPRLARLDKVRAAWLKGDIATTQLGAGNWEAVEWIKFLNDIDGKASAAQLQSLDKACHLTGTANNEVAFRFYRAGIKAGYEAVLEPVREFLMHVGRMKFAGPLYYVLLTTPAKHDWALAVYQQARPRYHPDTQRKLDQLIAQMGASGNK